MFTDWEHRQRFALTLFIVLSALLIRRVGIRRVRKSTRILEVGQRRAMSVLHHGAVITIVMTVLVLWLPQLQRFALSITAIAVALVVATNDIAKLVTTITVFCPTSAIVQLEKAMTREFFEWYRANRANRDMASEKRDID